MILGGDFLRILLGGFLGGDNLLWSFVFFALGSLAIFIGLRVISIVELLTGFLLILVVLFLFFKSWPFLPTTDFSFTFNWPAHFLAYGVVFYSLLGSSALMEARQMLRGREKKFKMAIFWGLAIPVAIYAVFALAVVSVSGPKTTPDAISGLVPFLGPGVVALGAFFGVVAVFSSYIVLGVCLRKVFQFDFGFSRLNAWIIVSFVPLILFLAGAKNLLLVIGLVGIVMGGLEGVLTILIYRRADRHGNRRPEYDVFVPKIVLWLLVAIFVLGMAYQLWMLK
ncbi:MAG: hypothetical protein COU85_00695 [Candidatus Portnoybacteria bacterium CG10_big_fil_rev_8_21_14_0_10_44_7]|uniref:Amino acid permease/ SLC12A domain-containing protein n=1 Tax=Candidatus Portnoybacteria bacterium CG10_big_fil_rev_8_21_14_0_10_44_7 TaxID=1974816 RepID=A0A2M8KJ87_9BACT|nr:MAG: hypothetical protein COU85_00695 [Candidatus Portnoybacteria bacterium CG10_big_fil_rev_8_21_14_0_10_44_7]